jgi:hypothetical protein
MGSPMQGSALLPHTFDECNAASNCNLRHAPLMSAMPLTALPARSRGPTGPAHGSVIQVDVNDWTFQTMSRVAT